MEDSFNKKIKYYCPNDIIYPFMVDRVIKYYEDNDLSNKSFIVENINDLLECFNILKYFEDYNSLGYKSIHIDKDEIGKKFKKEAGKYLSKIKNDVALIEIAKSVNSQYRDDLISIFCIFNKVLHNIITQKVIFFLCNNLYLDFILSNRSFVKIYRNEIKNFMFSHIETLHLFLIKDLINENAPFEINEKKLNILADQYLNLSKDKISIDALTKMLKIPAISKKNRFLANKLKDKIIEERVNWHILKTKIQFIPQEKPATFEIKKEEDAWTTFFSYDIDWLLKYLDYPTILNNFIHIFSFIDINHRITFISAPHFKESILIDFFQKVKNSSKEFDSNIIWAFVFKNIVLITKAYCVLLNSKGIYIEDVIDWFFTNYIKSEFSISNFMISISALKKVDSYLDKLKILIPEFESIFKQYESYCEFGFVDHDYINMALNQGENSYPESLKSSEIIYVEKSNSESCNIIFKELFSEFYQLDVLKGYKSLYEFLIHNHGPFDSEHFCNFYPNFHLLFETKILYKNAYDKTIVDYRRLKLLFEIESSGYVCLNFLDSQLQQKLVSLINENLLISYNSFLSKQENDLFNFVFNNKFCNEPLGIRNLYMHGNPKPDSKLHEYNYFVMLTMIISLVLKLKDAFVLKQNKDRNEGKFLNILKDNNTIILS